LPWLGLVCGAVDHLDSASDKDLPGFHGIEKAVVGPERNFGLVDLHHALQRLATAVEAFVGVRPALQERCASLATGRTDKPLRPTPLEQERRAARLVRKARLKLAQRSRPSHSLSPPARRRSPAHGTLILHIDQPWDSGVSLSQRPVRCPRAAASDG